MITGTGDEAIDGLAHLGTKVRSKIVGSLYDSGAAANIIPNLNWLISYGEGSGHVESLVIYDAADPESYNAVAEQLKDADRVVAEAGLGINMLENALSFNESALKAGRGNCPVDFVKYMKKIKKAIDPNDSSDSAFYVTPDDWE